MSDAKMCVLRPAAALLRETSPVWQLADVLLGGPTLIAAPAG
jgi:hypothetical protein